MYNTEVSGIPLSCTNFDVVLVEMDKAIRQGYKKNYISITNTESMYHAVRIPEHLSFIKGSNFSLCDGIGAVIAGYAWGYKIPRLNGPILMLKACEYGCSHGWRHFFYGGKEDVADMMVEKLKTKFPKLKIVGTYCPPFRPLTSSEDNDVVCLIKDAQPDIVWVGLGLLKQEKWISEHIKKISVPWMCGVGAAFDYHSGAVSWAPSWMQNIGMEWLYRTMLQPRLRIKRYVWSYAFMFQSIWQAFQQRLHISKKNTKDIKSSIKIDEFVKSQIHKKRIK